MIEKIFKELNFPKHKFKGALVGKVKNKKKFTYIRVYSPGAWDFPKGDHSINIEEGAELYRTKSKKEIESYTLFLLSHYAPIG